MQNLTTFYGLNTARYSNCQKPQQIQNYSNPNFTGNTSKLESLIKPDSILFKLGRITASEYPEQARYLRQNMTQEQMQIFSFARYIPLIDYKSVPDIKEFIGSELIPFIKSTFEREKQVQQSLEKQIKDGQFFTYGTDDLTKTNPNMIPLDQFIGSAKN